MVRKGKKISSKEVGKEAKGEPLFVATVSIKTPKESPRDSLINIARQARQLENKLLEYGKKKLAYIRNNIPLTRMRLIWALPRKERNEAYEKLWAEVKLTEQDLETYQQTIRGNYFYLKDKSALCQKIRSKVFNRIFKQATRQTGTARYKSSKGYDLAALETKELHSGIIVKPNTVEFDGIIYQLRWDKNNPTHTVAKLQVENYYKLQEQFQTKGFLVEVEKARAEVLQANPHAEEKVLKGLYVKAKKVIKKRVTEKFKKEVGLCAKYGRFIFKRTKNGSVCRLQIICEGIAPMSHNMQSLFIPNKSNTVDIGPTMIAHANKDASVVGNVDLTSEKRNKIMDEIKKLQRKKARCKKWSGRYKVLSNEIAYLHRCAVEVQQQDHAALHLEVLKGGKQLRKEDHGILFLQRNRHYSRRVSLNSPGKFLAGLKYKAEKAGGCMVEIDCRKAKLSQVCIFNPIGIKKPLSQRYHELPNGNQVQRDQYSAWLGNFVDVTTGELNSVEARKVWAANDVESRLQKAWIEAVHKHDKGKKTSKSVSSTLGQPQLPKSVTSGEDICRQPCPVSGSNMSDHVMEINPCIGQQGEEKELIQASTQQTTGVKPSRLQRHRSAQLKRLRG